jgi:hypothetical protein
MESENNNSTNVGLMRRLVRQTRDNCNKMTLLVGAGLVSVFVGYGVYRLLKKN